ncbi:hypothetical protein BDP27DRAFT_1372941 [Rhodocollybia butyracea]|uniref:Uncharacterized protein n=1 Tax=Rhodocollybia butyracea TaxID=206335 RepID=A0A9P5TXK2_9AGAR|nr:hypothetical protein BDP27DRAFT_1372941 [Rhodocollybia butyracea]
MDAYNLGPAPSRLNNFSSNKCGDVELAKFVDGSGERGARFVDGERSEQGAEHKQGTRLRGRKGQRTSVNREWRTRSEGVENEERGLSMGSGVNEERSINKEPGWGGRKGQRTSVDREWRTRSEVCRWGAEHKQGTGLGGRKGQQTSVDSK